MSVKWFIASVSMLLCFVAFPKALAQRPLPGDKPGVQERKPEGKDLIESVDGRLLYREYCATCHGVDAKGNGPAAPSLKKPPADLTRISQRNGGTFPLVRVQKVISGEDIGAVAHGNREMPIWGPIFGQIAWDQDLGNVRTYNLAKYLESLQQRK